MIIRSGGGNSGIAEYLEKGAKYGRHYSRDELDNRIIIDGDLDITDKIYNGITDRGQERYLHITLSFNEPDITVEKIQAAYEDYKSLLLQSYSEDEINTYAEIHWPKTQQILDRTTGQMHDRHPHVHMVIPKTNLLTGGYTNPLGMYERNLNSWEAIQEKVNKDHGLSSPALSPRVSIENYKSVLDRHKTSEFKTRSAAGAAKKDIFSSVQDGNIKTWDEYKSIVSQYGEVKIRNEGKPNEYLAVKLPEYKRFTNLNNPIFSKQFIENREIPHTQLTDYQIKNRLEQWADISKEIKYIDDSSAKTKKHYRELSDEDKSIFLLSKEASFYAKHQVPEPKPKTAALRQSYPKLGRESAANQRSLHDMPTLALVHSESGRRQSNSRAELLLPSDASASLRVVEADNDAGLQRPIHSSTRARLVAKEQIKSLSGQIVFNIEESAIIETANDLELFKEIRLNLDPAIVLAYAQANHLINPEKHETYKAKDGSARINFGKYNYNVSDFFTKGLGLEWAETEVILKSLYEAQSLGVKPEPVSNKTIKECLIDFEQTVYSVKIEEYKKARNSIDKDKSLSSKEINNRFFTENKRINALTYITRHEKELLKSINTFEKLVAEENLKAISFGNNESLNAIKYPFSDHFEKYLNQQKVLDMSLINQLKEKYAKPKENENQLENSISGKGFDFVLDGREASRRAKLTTELAESGRPNTEYGYSFKELRPQQEKDHIAFFKGSEKLFETHSNKTSIVGKPDFDKVATALAYSMQRYGNPLDINGTHEFKEQLIEVAARNGLKVEFTDPALNDALKERISALGLEAANENTISAEDLTLDMSLGESAALDKALIESKQREIETALKETPEAENDLAAIAIAQRKNEHEREPLTADTAAKDLALYSELKAAPAMQAYFAVTMATNAATNSEYRAEFMANQPKEFMLANHAARAFTAELETVYQQHKPLPDEFILDETAAAAMTKEQEETPSLENQTIRLEIFNDLNSRHSNLIASDREELAQHYIQSVDSRYENVFKSYTVDIKDNKLKLSFQGEYGEERLPEIELPKEIDTDMEALKYAAYIGINKEALEKQFFDMKALEKSENDTRAMDLETEAAVLASFNTDLQPLNEENAEAFAIVDSLTEFKAPNNEAEAKEVAGSFESAFDSLKDRAELRFAAFAAIKLAEASPAFADEMNKKATENTFVRAVMSEGSKELDRIDALSETAKQEEWQPEAPVTQPEAIDTALEKEMYASTMPEAPALDEPLELDPSNPVFEPEAKTNIQSEKIIAEFDELFSKHGSIDHFDGVTNQQGMIRELGNRHTELMSDIETHSETRNPEKYLETIKALEKNATLSYAVATMDISGESIDLNSKITYDLETFKAAIPEDMREAINELDHASKGQRDLTKLATELGALKEAEAGSATEINGIKAAYARLELQAFENDLSSTERQSINAMNQDFKQITKELGNYQHIVSSQYMRDGFNDMNNGTLNEASMTDPQYIDEAQKGALHSVIEQFKEENLTQKEKDSQLSSVSLTDMKEQIQANLNEKLKSNNLPELDISTYESTQSNIEKISVAQAFKLEPEPLNAQNAEAKAKANQIAALKAPVGAEEVSMTAQRITTDLEALRGKPELRGAALAVVALTQESPELGQELSDIGTDNAYLSAVMDTASRQIDIDLNLSEPDFDM